MKFINCNNMFLAEDLKKLKVTDPLSDNYEFEIEDIACLFSKNLNSGEIKSEIIIADTDLNALAFFMDTNEKRYAEEELIVILRNENIEHLLKIAKTNLFISSNYLKYCGIYVKDKDIIYKAANIKEELINENLLILIETHKVIEVNNEMKGIIRGKIEEAELSKIFQHNLRCMNPIEYTMEKIYEEIDLLELSTRVNESLVEYMICYKSKEKALDRFIRTVEHVNSNIKNQFEFYEAWDITEYLEKVSLGRIEPEVIEKANLIHNFYERQKDSIFIEMEKLFVKIQEERKK
ncbi:MAG: hypothetical protein KBB10_06065 [Clostridia bacterium]|nr:hypothetical protein [Clostridia bacterium]